MQYTHTQNAQSGGYNQTQTQHNSAAKGTTNNNTGNMNMNMNTSSSNGITQQQQQTYHVYQHNIQQQRYQTQEPNFYALQEKLQQYTPKQPHQQQQQTQHYQQQMQQTQQPPIQEPVSQRREKTMEEEIESIIRQQEAKQAAAKQAVGNPAEQWSRQINHTYSNSTRAPLHQSMHTSIQGEQARSNGTNPQFTNWVNPIQWLPNPSPSYQMPSRQEISMFTSQRNGNGNIANNEPYKPNASANSSQPMPKSSFQPAPPMHYNEFRAHRPYTPYENSTIKNTYDSQNMSRPYSSSPFPAPTESAQPRNTHVYPHPTSSTYPAYQHFQMSTPGNYPLYRPLYKQVAQVPIFPVHSKTQHYSANEHKTYAAAAPPSSQMKAKVPVKLSTEKKSKLKTGGAQSSKMSGGPIKLNLTYRDPSISHAGPGDNAIQNGSQAAPGHFNVVNKPTAPKIHSYRTQNTHHLPTPPKASGRPMNKTNHADSSNTDIETSATKRKNGPKKLKLHLPKPRAPPPPLLYPSSYSTQLFDPTLAKPPKDAQPGEIAGIPIFTPTLEEFASFDKFVARIRPFGLAAGIAKVIPPKEWLEANPPIPRQKVESTVIRQGIKQILQGNAGVYRSWNVEDRNAYSVREFCDLANSREYRTPKFKVDESLSEPELLSSEISSAPGSLKSDSDTESDIIPDDSSADECRELDEREVRRIKRKEAKQAQEDIEAAKEAVKRSSFVISHTLEFEQDIRNWLWKISGAQIPKKCQGIIEDDNLWQPPPAPIYGHLELTEIERQYWKNLTFCPAIYGADLAGSLFDRNLATWNVSKLENNILQRLGAAVSGVNTPYLYFGMWKATFCWHVEDMDLYSINYIHFGAPKFWYSIPASAHDRFEQVAKNTFGQESRNCSQFLRHKSFIISPTVLRNAGIPVYKCIHNEGEFMLTFPRGYHSGFNCGFNAAESINFADETWIEDYGQNAMKCECADDSVNIDIGALKSGIYADEAGNGISDQEEEISANGHKRPNAESEDEDDGPLVPVKKLFIKLGRRQVACVLCTTRSTKELVKTDIKHKWAHIHCAEAVPETFVVELGILQDDLPSPSAPTESSSTQALWAQTSTPQHLLPPSIPASSIPPPSLSTSSVPTQPIATGSISSTSITTSSIPLQSLPMPSLSTYNLTLPPLPVTSSRPADNGGPFAISQKPSTGSLRPEVFVPPLLNPLQPVQSSSHGQSLNQPTSATHHNQHPFPPPSSLPASFVDLTSPPRAAPSLTLPPIRLDPALSANSEVITIDSDTSIDSGVSSLSSNFVSPSSIAKKHLAVMGVGLIPKSRWKLKCHLCKISAGAPVQCSKGQCARAFHVPCGKEAGFYFKRIQETRDVCDVAVQMYCALHDPRVEQAKHEEYSRHVQNVKAKIAGDEIWVLERGRGHKATVLSNNKQKEQCTVRFSEGGTKSTIAYKRVLSVPAATSEITPPLTPDASPQQSTPVSQTLQT